MNGIRLIPVELIDCAGLVPGAWQGRGLGNQFLDEIRKADALIHVVDAAGGTDSEGRLVKVGSHDPLEDVKFLEVEITMWLSQIIKREWPKMARTVESGAVELYQLLEERFSGLAIRRAHIFEAVRKTELNADRPTAWTDDDLLRFLDTLRGIAKPMLIAGNKIDLEPAPQNVERLKTSNNTVVPCSAEAELALRRAADKGIIDYKPGDGNFNILKSEGLTDVQKKALQTVREKILLRYGTTGVQEAINMAYFRLLTMIVVYPVEDVEKLTNHKGQVLPDAYVVPYGTTARQLAYLIHTEIGESFIYAVEAREKKRIGEDHVLKDRDVISIVSARKRA